MTEGVPTAFPIGIIKGGMPPSKIIAVATIMLEGDTHRLRWVPRGLALYTLCFKVKSPHYARLRLLTTLVDGCI